MLLGTVVLGDDRGDMPYGRDTAHDVAACVERIASQIDVPEVVPIS